MKNTFGKLLSLSFVMLVAFTSCQKTEKHPVLSNSHSTARLTPNSTLPEIYTEAKQTHNDYLANEFSAITQGTFNTNDINDYSNSYGVKYFSANGYDHDGTMQMFNNMIANKGDRICMEMINGITNTKMDAVFEWSMAAMETITNPADYDVLLTRKLSDVSQDPNFTTEEKQIVAGALGVTSGSFEYWYNNNQAWLQATGKKNNPPVQTTAARSAWSYFSSFVQADAAGAYFGGMAGSVVPGMGTAAGSIAGGAFVSGAEALGW